MNRSRCFCRLRDRNTVQGKLRSLQLTVGRSPSSMRSLASCVERESQDRKVGETRRDLPIWSFRSAESKRRGTRRFRRLSALVHSVSQTESPRTSARDHLPGHRPPQFPIPWAACISSLFPCRYASALLLQRRSSEFLGDLAVLDAEGRPSLKRSFRDDR